MSPRRRSRRRARRNPRIVTIQWTPPATTFTPQHGFMFMPDGWAPEAGKDYQIIVAKRGDEPEERWYRVMPVEEETS